MSAGHSHAAAEPRHAAQYDHLLLQPWFQLALERPCIVITTFDLPYVAGSAVYDAAAAAGPWRIYVDRHAYPVVLRAGLLPGLLCHERVEGILLEHGWHYEIEPLAAHLVACVAEDRENLKRGWLREAADIFYRPLIKADEHERLISVPADLHMEPYTERPVDGRLLARMRAAMSGMPPTSAPATRPGYAATPKYSHDAVHYGPGRGGEYCRTCRHSDHGMPPHCDLVEDPIDPGGWCVLFEPVARP